MQIRPLLPQDNRIEVSHIYEQSWKYSYHDIIPADFLSSIPEGKWCAGLDAPGRHSLVLTEDDQMVGTSSYSASRFEEFAGYGEIISIYLLPNVMKKGYGSQLLNAVISQLQELGYRDLFLWVLEENKSARAFYEKNGFQSTSHILEDTIGGKTLKNIAYTYHIECE